MKHFPTQFDSIGDFKTKAKLILKSDAEYTTIRQENAVFISSKKSRKNWRKWKNVELFDQLLNTQIGVHS